MNVFASAQSSLLNQHVVCAVSTRILLLRALFNLSILISTPLASYVSPNRNCNQLFLNNRKLRQPDRLNPTKLRLDNLLATPPQLEPLLRRHIL